MGTVNFIKICPNDKKRQKILLNIFFIVHKRNSGAEIKVIFNNYSKTKNASILQKKLSNNDPQHCKNGSENVIFF